MIRASGVRRTIPYLAAVLVLASALVAPGASSAGDRSPGTYDNPLAPRILGSSGTVDSCADPTVLRGQQRGDRHWYLYCTTDPLNDADTEGGEPRFHPVPMLRSRNLVDWRYVGDALPRAPSWAADGAGLWAPDVVWSRATHRYYLTFVVTDVDDEISGEPGCSTDSAIGVAVSRGPTGPWRVSEQPVVGPRRNPEGTGCDFWWTFDPDVLGDAVGARGFLYYGSYFGGIFGTRVSFDRRGVETAGEPRRITIGNRYEASNVVRRNDWYYLFASATNCCNGPLTGYSVFAGRSRSPLGPFVDREGQRLLAGRVGGTPVLSMNGNRWVGAGHNSVFQDRGGQWWTAYHAVDRSDPYFAGQPGFTKRPVLLDPLDWVDGWPSVRSGRWASDQPMPTPAARPGQTSAYTPDPVPPLRPGRLLNGPTDELDGTSLGRRWSWVREPPPSTYSLGEGSLRVDTDAGDLANDSDDAPVLTQAAPERDYVVQTAVRLDVPAEGCCHNFVQAGLVLYDGDDRYLKLTHVSIWETRQTEWAKEVPHPPDLSPAYGNTAVGAPGDVTRLRVVRDGNRYTAYTSAGGEPWMRGGTWVHRLGDGARIGLVAMGGEGFEARFRYVRVRTLRD